MVDNRIDANNIKTELEHLIEKARLIAPKLAERLNELKNWIKKVAWRIKKQEICMRLFNINDCG